MLTNRSFQFDPHRIAYLETAGWRAYYERNWLKLLSLVLALCQEQFHIPFPLSVFAAYYVTRASAAWAPINHNEAMVQHYYERFYRLAARHSGLQFDPTQVAALELRYNAVHRELVGQEDKTRFVDAMIELHAAVFGLDREVARPSAELRVAANNLVDRITSKQSNDPERDWIAIEQLLRECYRSIQQALAVRS